MVWWFHFDIVRKDISFNVSKIKLDYTIVSHLNIFAYIGFYSAFRFRYPSIQKHILFNIQKHDLLWHKMPSVKLPSIVLFEELQLSFVIKQETAFSIILIRYSTSETLGLKQT